MIALTLAVICILWGLLAFWVFRRFTDRAALRIVRKRLYARLMEIRLFAEEPSLVWKAQKAVVAENLRFLALIWKPVLILGVPFALLYSPLDSIYGWAPLPVGRSALVTLQLGGSGDTQPILRTPSGIVVETAAVRIVRERQVIWRIRPLASTRGDLSIQGPDGGKARGIEAGEPDLSFHHRREPVSGAAWMEVDYPPALVKIAGLSLNWLIWFVIFSTASAGLCALRLQK